MLTQLGGNQSVVATLSLDQTMTEDDDSDWLHRNNTYQRATTKDQYSPKASSDHQGSLL